MRLWKAITAKSFDLIEQPVCKVRGVALAEHALLELVLEGEELAVLAPVADRAPQGVGFSSRESSATMARRITCSWNIGTPSVRDRTDSMSLLG